LAELLSGLAESVGEEAHPLLRTNEEPSRIRLVLVTSDRGLCGAYNSTLIRQADAYLRARANRETSLTIVGRKGVDYYRRRTATIADRFVQIAAPSVELARDIARKVTSEFAEGRVDRVELFFNAFRSALSQVPTVETLLPVAVEGTPQDAKPAEPILEPDRAALLDRLLPQFVEVRIYRALLEAAASEHGSRMTAMDSATSNAAKMIFSLTLAMNRSRQAAITKELMEIVSGAEALKG
jgi:F-type H+-transporting ATPase subunit gamma